MNQRTQAPRGCIFKNRGRAAALTLAWVVAACGDDARTAVSDEASALQAVADGHATAGTAAGGHAAAGAAMHAAEPASVAPGSGATDASVTYAEHVRPILAKHCVNCHSPGGGGPFALDSYAQAKALAGRIAHVTRARTMPPSSSIDNSGQCNTFRDVAWLSEEEIETLERWSKGGTPEGDSSIPAPAAPTLPKLDGKVLSVSTPPYVPSKEKSDDYRCFVLKSPFTEPTYVTGFDTRPGDADTAHHMVVFAPMGDAFVKMAEDLDAKDPGPGYSCFGSPGVPASILAAWTPGVGSTLYPDNLGLAVVPNRALIVQMHYNTLHADHPGEDSTRIDLQVRTEGVSPAAFVQLLDLDMNLPPGQKVAEEIVRGNLALQIPQAKGPLEVHGVYPHMHELGMTQTLSFEKADGTKRCLFDVPRYRFVWQRMYLFDKPILIDPKAELSLRCQFDTTSRTQVTKWGEGTQDEMCVTGLLVKL